MSPNLARLRFLSLTVVSLLLCLFIGNVALVTPAHADLPPRPTLPPVEEDEDEPTRPLVAPLILSTDPNRSDLWSVVQWQGAAGNWHDVAGWRGVVDKGRTIWWVEQKDFGKGPFRWVIQQGEDGPVVATSALFTLPSQPQQALVVEVVIP